MSHQAKKYALFFILGVAVGSSFYSRPDRLPGRPVSAAPDNSLPRLSFPSCASFGELVFDPAFADYARIRNRGVGGRLKSGLEI
jgi:hypothetical protein